MQEMLRELYGGSIYPSEQGRPKTEEYSVLVKNFSKHKEEFKQKIGVHFYDELQRIMDEQFNIFDLELEQAFINGFCLGARMIIEVYEGKPLNE